MKTYIGVDLGGTNVRVAKVDETGAILQIVKEPTEIGKGVEQVVSKIISMIERIEGYEAVAGMGEALQGAGKGKDIVYYVTISTGIGGALVVNQKVIAGRNGHAGEIANLIIDRNREKVNYLNVGAVENEASGTAITRKGKAAFGEDAVQHAGDVFDLARKGNAKALEICDAVAYDLAVMFSQIAHVVDPEVFVVGGGVMKGKDVFFDKMENYFRNMIHKGMQTVVFMEAELDEPGIIGAAMLPMAYVKE